MPQLGFAASQFLESVLRVVRIFVSEYGLTPLDAVTRPGERVTARRVAEVLQVSVTHAFLRVFTSRILLRLFIYQST